MKRYDLVVIGGGTAGLVASLGAAGIGARVALVERDRTGGDCLWTGCVPSKSLIAAAELAQRMRDAESVGLTPVEPQVDFAAVMTHVRAAQARIEPHDSPERLRREGVEVIDAEAEFVAPGRIQAGGRELAYRTALVATGSSPALPPIPGLAAAAPLTSDTVWELERLPARLVVLGGGPVGCELGQAFARLGSHVTLIEVERRLLGKEEPEASELVAECLRADGVGVRLGVPPARAEPGRLILADREEIPFDALLVATGRKPRTKGVGLERIGVEIRADGSIAVDERLRTSARNVFAAGDVVGALPFTHVAAEHARIAVANALFKARRSISYDAVPWTTFTSPEVGRVGLREADARERLGDGVQSWRFDYAQLDRAIVTGETAGFAKLVADRRGRLIGATVAAPRGGEAIAEMAAWIRQGRRLDDVSQQVHAYPTFAEGPSRAAHDYMRAKYFTDRVRAVTRPALAALRLLDRPR